MASMLLCLLLAGPVIPPRATPEKATPTKAIASAEGERPTPLTKTQITKLRRVVRRTQDRNTELKTALNGRQQKLMQAYSQFTLDETHIAQLHQEIIDLQKDLLKNYRDLQVELRDIVGEQRFTRLKRRIDFILKSPKKGKTPREAATKPRPAPARKSPAK